MRERKGNAIRTGFFLLVILGLMVSAWGCRDGFTSDAGLTFEEVRSRIESLAAGETFEFFLHDLTSEAAREYLEYLGRPGDDPADYADALIRYELVSGSTSGARGSSYCLRRTETVGHSAKCERKAVITKSGSCWYPYGDGCHHAGYTMNRRGRQTLKFCIEPGCPYHSLTQTWTHSPD